MLGNKVINYIILFYKHKKKLKLNLRILYIIRKIIYSASLDFKT